MSLSNREPMPTEAVTKEAQRHAERSVPVTVRPGDPRYGHLVVGNNRRFVAAPEAVLLARTTDEVRSAVQKAVRSGKRVSLRSGGHCYADFVYHSEAEVIIDLSEMNRVTYDPRRRAFMVEAGAELGDVYETLYRLWGVTLPGGICPEVGVGGHATAGGNGLLARRYGVVADHIEAVEMVVVDGAGTVRTVVASRDSSGSLRDLWWACAGGGGGSFGVVTRFWFRSADASGTDPGRQLPRPPREVLVHQTGMPWDQLNEETLTRLMQNFGAWHEEHSSADDPYAVLSGNLFIQPGPQGGVGLLTQVDATVPDAEGLLSGYNSAIAAGTRLFLPPARRLLWLPANQMIGGSKPHLLTDPTKRSAVRSAYMRTRFTAEQCSAVYRNMTRPDYANPHATIQLSGVCGGAVNNVDPAATAYVHRNSVYLALFENFWEIPEEDEQHVAWLRDTYGQTFAATGGYPVPGERTDGCYIGSPDLDITDDTYNTSGTPWHELYFKSNYARLQRTKQCWDPTDFFRHRQSIRLP